MTGSAAAFLTAHFLGAVADLGTVLGLVCSLTLVGQVLLNVEIDRVVVRLDAEDSRIQGYFLSRFGSVDFVN